jgi:hypothetical protein
MAQLSATLSDLARPARRTGALALRRRPHAELGDGAVAFEPLNRI